MIDVFETWFSQFTREEQEKLLKHIQRNHLSMINEYASSFSDKTDRRLSESASQAVRMSKSRVVK